MSHQPGIELKRSKYRLLGLVGQGQFGRVFCAVHRQTGQLVALKELEHQRFPTHKFLRELRFLLSLQHANIVTCQALEHTSTGRYLVMDYCEGGTLRSLMSEENRLSLPYAIELVADILAGLEHAHSRDIVHCDIKPENILLSVEPTGWTARISDFGVARLGQELSSQEFGNTGSPAYMAPERFYGQYSRTSDLYSVGILLFELMAGQRPFSGTPADLMSAHLNQPVKIPDTVPIGWHPLIRKALQKLSARRFQSAGEMLAMLRSIAAVEGMAAQQSSQVAPLPLFQARLDQASEMRFLAPETRWNRVASVCPICALMIRPQGCFVVTPRSVHLIPLETISLQTISLETEAHPGLLAHPVLELQQDCQVAIDPQGRWLTTLTTGCNSSDSTTCTLTVWRLPGQSQSTHAGVSRAISIHLPSPSIAAHLSTLDRRHLAIAIDRVAEENAAPARASVGSLIQVLTRRGNRVGTLPLPIRIGHLTSTPLPNRLLATDRDNPGSILLIDLKPYRIARLGVAIQPTFLVATTWGYVAANPEGVVACLDRDGRPIGQLLAPASITAIAAIEPYGLLVSTWDGEQGNLHRLDLRQSSLELLF